MNEKEEGPKDSALWYSRKDITWLWKAAFDRDKLEALTSYIDK